MFTEIVDAIGSWASHLVFSPTVWLGAMVGGVGIVLIVVSGMLRARQVGKSEGGPSRELPSGRAPRSAPVTTSSDPEMDEIEAILRKRGIS